MTVFVFCDGSAAGAECGAAAVAMREDGRVLGWEARALPAVTNNEAEYAGLLLGIELAARLRAREPVFALDSEIVAGQMSGSCAVNSAALRRWHWRAVEALRDLPRATFRVIPREWNRAADGLAAQAGLAWPRVRDYLLQAGAGNVAPRARGAQRKEPHHDGR